MHLRFVLPETSHSYNNLIYNAPGACFTNPEAQNYNACLNFCHQCMMYYMYDTAVAKLYANFNTLTLPELYTYHILKFVHNCIYNQNKLPSIFTSYFVQNYDPYAEHPL